MHRKVNIFPDFLTYSDYKELFTTPIEIAAVKGAGDNWYIFEENGQILCQTTSEENAEFIAEALAAREIVFPLLEKIFDT